MMRVPDESARPVDDAAANVGAADTTLTGARDMLAAAGVGARVERAGHAHDVLVVHAQPSTLTALHDASHALRALGFRYVTIDITDA